jgi:hypothetical protein
VNQQIALEIEQKLRKFVSEILNPFNDRIGALNKDVKSLKIADSDKNNQFLSLNT